MADLLQPGTAAPDFELPTGPGETAKLSDYKGQPVILAFYPADWSPVCGDQMTLYNEMLDVFDEYDAQMIGISVDGIWCHKAFAEARSLQFPLLADFEPKGAVARQFNAYHDERGVTERALFVLDKDGTIVYSHLSPMGENPGADGILKALKELKGEG
jgi:peroxiredoxin